MFVDSNVVGILRSATMRERSTVGGLVKALQIAHVARILELALPGPTGGIRWPAPSPNHAPLLADRKPEFEAFERMITGKSNEQRLLLLQGTSAAGKSLLCASLPNMPAT